MPTADQQIDLDRANLPSMLATLCSYESRFGPRHPQTLCLMARVAVACWQAGEHVCARALLERVIRDFAKYLDRTHDLRLRAILALSKLLLADREYERAVAIQRELLECQVQRFGSEHPETMATRANLGSMLMMVGPTGRA